MNDAYISILVYCLWMICLLFVMLIVRVKAVRAGLKPKDITPFNENISAFANRLSRAHANCYENLPVFVSITVVAALNDMLSIMQGSALIFIAARLLQSVTHLCSGRARYAMLRGAFFGVQVFIQIYWIVIIALKLL